jgi:hypothetical protein
VEHSTQMAITVPPDITPPMLGSVGSVPYPNTGYGDAYATDLTSAWVRAVLLGLVTLSWAGLG